MAKNDNLTDFLTDVANAIREKKGTSNLINPQNFSNEIKGIVTGKYNIEVVEEADGTQTLNITDWDYVPKFDRVFANNTPAQISAVSAEIAKQGYTSAQVAEIYGWNLGDEIEIVLKNGWIIHPQIIGINHDTLSSDHTSKAGLTLQMRELLPNTYQMNTTPRNSGGWPVMSLRTSTMTELFDLLPDEWQTIVLTVDKLSMNAGKSYTETVTSQDKLFVPSRIELTGTTGIAQYDTEGIQYEFWKGKGTTDRVKYKDTKATSWWTRTPGYDNVGTFVYIFSSGDVFTYGCTSLFGVSVCFCV